MDRRRRAGLGRDGAGPPGPRGRRRPAGQGLHRRDHREAAAGRVRPAGSVPRVRARLPSGCDRGADAAAPGRLQDRRRVPRAVNGPITDRVARSRQTPEGWRKFGFDVRARINVEPGGDAAPRFRIEIEEVKRRDLDGATGLVAKALGQLFDDIVTQFANGRASRLSDRLNAEIARRVTLFKEYGVFCGIEYSQSELLLHFDLTRLRGEGIAGYVFAEERPGTVPLYRWFHPADGSHYYTIHPNAPDRPRAVGEGVACYVLDHRVNDAVPLYRWSNGYDHLYTSALDGERAGRLGYKHRGVACFVFHDPQPGTVPLYRFFDPRRRQHFYTLHPYAEFLK